MLGIRTVPGDAVTHRLSPAFLTEFCSGAITAKSMSVLRASVYSQRRAMLLAVMRQSSTHPAVSGFRAEMEESWNILAELEKHVPAVVESVLMHPSTGVWLVRALRALLGRGDLEELHYLGCVAAAAAIRAGHPCVVMVPAIHEIVSLPTVGNARIHSPKQSVELRNSSTSTAIHVGQGIEPIVFRWGTESPGFSPTHYHHATARGHELLVEIDDSHPYREFTGPAEPDLLSNAEWAQWHELFDSAWDVLTQRHRGYAEELSAGLRTIAPVRGNQGFAGSSSNAAFGAVVLSSKSSEAALAEVLIHELQHSKLNALLELVTLRHEGPERWWYAPWRADPRPLTGLLHGIYAFVSVVEFWREQRDHVTDERLAREGAFAFAYRRSQVRTAVDALAGVPELTEFGSQFVNAVSDRLAVCEADPVPDELAETVALLMKDHWLNWRLHHVRPDDEYLGLLATAWRHNKAAPAGDATDRVEPRHLATTSTTRSTLLRTRVADLDRHAELAASATEADVAFALGDYDTAKSHYLRRIRVAPGEVHAWAGLALTAQSHALQATPEVVMDLHNRLLGQANPLELAAWLDTRG